MEDGRNATTTTRAGGADRRHRRRTDARRTGTRSAPTSAVSPRGRSWTRRWRSACGPPPRATSSLSAPARGARLPLSAGGRSREWRGTVKSTRRVVPSGSQVDEGLARMALRGSGADGASRALSTQILNLNNVCTPPGCGIATRAPRPNERAAFVSRELSLVTSRAMMPRRRGGAPPLPDDPRAREFKPARIESRSDRRDRSLLSILAPRRDLTLPPHPTAARQARYRAAEACSRPRSRRRRARRKRR
jgi:hypothetical protein